MVGRAKKVVNKSVKRKTVIFNRFETAYSPSYKAAFAGVLGGENTALCDSVALCAKTSRNCDAAGGVLRQGTGAEVFVSALGNSLTKLAVAGLERVVAIRSRANNTAGFVERFFLTTASGMLYLYDEGAQTCVDLIEIGKDPHIELLRSASGAERCLIVSENDARFLDESGTVTPVGISGLRNAFCVCKNRLFIAQNGSKLLYSDPMTPWSLGENIDGCGCIRLPIGLGEAVNLVALDEYVYIFFARALMRLHVSGSGRDFELEEIAYNGAKVVYGSVCAVSDGVIFCTDDGLWKVQGRTVRRFAERLSLPLSSQDATCNAAVFGDKYFLRYLHRDGFMHSLAVALDGKDWDTCFDLAGLHKGFDAPLFVRNRVLYRLGGALPVGENSLFESVDMDFGVRGRKTLRYLELLGEGEIVLLVYADKRNMERKISFNGKSVRVPLDLRGESFAFRFVLKENAVVYGLRVEMES